MEDPLEGSVSKNKTFVYLLLSFTIDALKAGAKVIPLRKNAEK